MTDILSEQVPSYDILEVAPQVISGGGGAWGTITGTMADQTDLNTALGGKAATVHVHATSDVTGLDTALGLLAPKSAPTFTTSATFSFLTPGRVPYATTGGSVIDSANFTFNGTAVTVQSAVAATSTDGLVLATTATATSGNQKYSPRIRFSGSYFSGSAKTTDWTIENLPNASGGVLAFYHSDNGATYVVKLTLGSDGSVNAVDVLASGQVQVVSTGAINATGYSSASTKIIGFSSTTNTNLSQDVILMREAAANLRLGAAASASPVAQTLSVQDGSGTNIAPVVWVHRGCRGTGDSGGAATFNAIKSHSFHTPDIGSTGSTLQTATEKFYIKTTGVRGGKVFTVANLPTGAAGERAFVSDATVTTFASTVAGGGANQVPVYHNGTNWCIG